jgi:hypothetical protein
MGAILTHSSAEFKKNELKTLEYIHARGFFDNDFERLATSVSTFHSKYQGLGKKAFDFMFVSDFKINIEKKSHRVAIHAGVIGNYSETTYSLGVCNKDTNELIRKFHFDYVHNNGGKKQKVPRSHIQYGGKSGVGYDGIAFTTDGLENWLSEPRLYYPPINLALLLDLVFTEFQNEKTKNITDNPDWRSLIRDNEIFVFKDYYKAMSDHIGSARHKKELLLRDICYI